MSGDKLSQAPNLKYIGLFATGYNNIDFDYTRTHGITVCNAGSYSTEAVAQHVFALILHNYNTVSKYDDFVKEGGWTKTDKFSPFTPMCELYQKTIGIIGYGSIGRKVAQIAKAFGMNVVAYSRHKNSGEEDGVRFSKLEELLECADIVSMHCPLNSESEKMCNVEFFERMKSNALFINTSRGGVVDEDALVYALNHGIIGGAALDVIETEPMKPDCRLLEANNITITPHAAWAPLETRTRLVKIVSENLKKWLARTPINVIE
jgi:glycerate dehydrogenase